MVYDCVMQLFNFDRPSNILEFLGPVNLTFVTKQCLRWAQLGTKLVLMRACEMQLMIYLIARVYNSSIIYSWLLLKENEKEL